MKKVGMNLLIVAGLYIVVCGLLYVFQEKLIFFPEKLDKNYVFKFDEKFEELNIKSTDGNLINGLLFKATNSKGLIFYLHGNGGSLKSWGVVANTFTDLNYDLFIMDYKGYGKSEGKIKGEAQLFQDNQTVYDELKKVYPEEKIIVLGYSIGSGLAAKLASMNHPKLLILHAPYYNLSDMMRKRFPVIPTFILRYNFKTNEYLQNCNMPVVIFHGKDDEVIYYGSALKLEKEFKPGDTLITLDEQPHMGIEENPVYKTALRKIILK